MRLVTIALLACCTCAATAQSYVVTGRVVDSVSGSPVARAALTLEAIPAVDDTAAQQPTPPGSLGSAISDNDGRFQITGVAEGRYRLSAARRGYLASSLRQHGSFSSTVVVGPGVTGSHGIEFPLSPEASIRGTVLDSSGDPVEGGSVTLFSEGQDGSGQIRRVGASPISRQSSTFSFADLAPGTYYLAASARPWFAQPGFAGDKPNPLDVVYPLTFWDGAANAEQAQPLQLSAGDAGVANFSLGAVAAVHIEAPLQMHGNVFMIDFNIASDAFGAMMPNMNGFTVHQGSGGAIASVAVAPGSYLVRRGAETTTVDASSGTVSVPAESDDAVPVTGAIAMEDGSALPPGLAVLLEPVRADGGSFVASGPAAAGFGRGAGGSLRLDVKNGGMLAPQSVPPGTYRLSLAGSDQREPLVITGAEAQGASVSPGQLFHVETKPVVLAATISRASGSLAGLLQGADGAMILLVPLNRNAVTLYRQAEAATDGTWVIVHVPPGRYQLLAIRDGWDLHWKEAGVLDRYLTAAASVIVRATGGTLLDKPLVVQAR